MDSEHREPLEKKAFVKRHFFLAGAVGLVAVMLVAAAVRIVLPSANPATQQRGGRMTQVAAVAAQMHVFVDRIEALGTAKGAQSVDLTANTTELITAVHFHDGEMVRRGDVLVDLKSSAETAEVDQARAALEVARNTYNRYQRLAEAGFLSQAAMDQYTSDYHQAEANLAAAQSRQQDRVIRAPFAGRLGLTDVAPGALVNPGAVIVTLDDVSVMRVDFDVPDRYLPVLQTGATIQARPDPYPDRVVTGHIARVDSRIDPNTHAIRARAEFSNANGLLVPGMLMHIAIENGQRQAVSVPEASVQASGDQSYVYVIAHEGQRTVAKQTPVVIGANDAGVVEIRQGLSVGAQIIADGLDRIEPNAPIRVVGPHAGGGNAGTHIAGAGGGAGLRGRESQ